MLGALILTGGRSARMGEDKAELVWRGRRAVDWAHDLALSCGAATVATVGFRSYGFRFVPDLARYGGPVAGVMGGAAALRTQGVDRLLVLAVDAPTIEPDDLAPLLSEGRGCAYEGLHLPFVAPISRLASDALPDRPLARLIERSGLVRIAAAEEALPRLRGANTPTERQSLLAAFIG